MRGAIWYQGEGNCLTVDQTLQYRVLLPTLIADWRARWGLGNFSFYIAQLANFNSQIWRQTRDAQLMTLRNTPNVGLGVNIDIGQYDNVHPTNKVDVGIRLAKWALAKDYGQNIVPSGPLCNHCTIEGSKIRVFFDYAETGLMVGQKVVTNAVQEIVGGTLATFEIGGADLHFVAANAVIDGTTVLVSSPSVSAPVWARYAWSANPACNFYNRAGLPASPFQVTTNAHLSTPITVTNNVVTIPMTVANSSTYWIDYRDNLNSSNWTSLIMPRTSTGAVFVVTNVVSGVSQRFYRVNQVPWQNQ